MRLLVANVALALLLGAGLLTAQDPRSAPPKGERNEAAPAKAATLEELLAKAAKANPDIRVAESKLREAEAELNRVRLIVMQKVVKLHHEIAAHKALVQQAEENLKRLVEVARAVSRQEMSIAEFAVQQAKANLAKVEAEMPFLLGKQPAEARRVWVDEVGALAEIVIWDVQSGKQLAPAVSGTVADKIRKALDTPVKLELTNVPLSEALDYLRQRLDGINLLHYAGKVPPDVPITVRFTEAVPFGAVAQWFEDTINVRFVIRDYGIVIAEPKHIPPGAVLLHDFWKSNATKKTTAGSKETK